MRHLGNLCVSGSGSGGFPARVGSPCGNEQLLDEPKAREIIRLRVQAIAEHVRSLRASR
jgi:hypothetical protein